MNSDSSDSYDGSAQHLDVAVIGGGQAGLAIGYFLSQQGCRFVILERGERARACMARALGLADALHAPSLQRAARASVPRRSGRLPDPRRGDRLPRALRRDLRAADRAEQRGQEARARRRRALPPRASMDGRSPPTRSSSRPGLSRRRTCRSSSRSSPAMSSRRTPSATAGRTRCRRGQCSWSVAATPAFRSRRSSRRRTRSCSRSVRARSRCPSACSGATSSGG